MNKSIELIERLFSFYEESTGPCPVEIRSDMLNQIMNMIPHMEPGMMKEFDDFVHFFGAQKFGLSGTTEEILKKMHPWMLQQVQQRFHIPAPSPDGTPGMGGVR